MIHVAKRKNWLFAVIVLLAGVPGFGQPVFRTVFPPEEFAARRAKVFAQIGDGLAVLAGATERPGEQAFRQGNEFYYLCGVAEPRAILLLDGRTKRSVVYLPALVERDRDSKYGPGMLSPGADSARETGLDAVLPRDQFGIDLAALARGAEKRILYTPMRPETLEEASSSDVVLLNRLNLSDPWDGRPSREAIFREKVAAITGGSVRDLDPIVDELRAIKSEREIAIIREATKMTMQGMKRAMQRAKVGEYEYQLQADMEYMFRKKGAYGVAYFSLVATGQNSWYSHYHRDTARLEAGQLVQIDDAPDYKYYVSDLSRIFPASGKFSVLQRERYELYLQLYRALLNTIAPHVTPQKVLADATVKMDGILAANTFADDAAGRETKRAATEFVAGLRTRSTAKQVSLGHSVGMEVHDQSGVFPPYATLEPGAVFTIEPAIKFLDDHTGMRIEDTLLITDNGVENMSADLPEDVKGIEKLMASPLPEELQ